MIVFQYLILRPARFLYLSICLELFPVLQSEVGLFVNFKT